VKIALALGLIFGLGFVAGASTEEKLEWRTCHALAVFETGAPPAWASSFKVRRPVEPARPVELARR
jgi:hypothetical protein